MKFFTKRKLLILLALLPVLFFIIPEEQEPITSDFSHHELLKINPDGVIDEYTLRSPENYQTFGSNLVGNMVKRGILDTHPLLGAIFKQNPPAEGITIVFQSPGGYVSLGKQAADMLSSFRANNIHITCVVSEAQSMAFFVLITQCDNIIAKKSVKLMQHKVHLVQHGSNSPLTFMMDLEMARKEAEVLGVDFNKWLKLTRLKKADHIFTQKEIRDYKLVDGWME
jgi:ATP-dependent protease ClpP protease subunit